MVDWWTVPLQQLKANNKTHYDVGAKVRQTIKELDGTMPENLENPSKGIKEIQSSKKPDYNTIGE